jgi:hypothetical protein
MPNFDPARRELLKLTAATSGALAAGPFLPNATAPAAAQGASVAANPVANAIFHATGKRIRSLPVTPDKLL